MFDFTELFNQVYLLATINLSFVYLYHIFFEVSKKCNLLYKTLHKKVLHLQQLYFYLIIKKTYSTIVQERKY